MPFAAAEERIFLRKRAIDGLETARTLKRTRSLVLFLGSLTVCPAGALAAQEEAADSTHLFKAARSDTGYDMSLEELSRDGNRSLVRVEIRLATSVGGLVWIACQMAEPTEYRGFRYHVVLDVIEKTAPAGGERFPMTNTMDVGFLNSDAVDLKAEFGVDSFDEDEGEIVHIEQFALLC